MATSRPKKSYLSIEEVFDYLDNKAFIAIENLHNSCYGNVVLRNWLLVVRTTRIGMVSLFKMWAETGKNAPRWDRAVQREKLQIIALHQRVKTFLYSEEIK